MAIKYLLNSHYFVITDGISYVVSNNPQDVATYNLMPELAVRDAIIRMRGTRELALTLLEEFKDQIKYLEDSIIENRL